MKSDSQNTGRSIATRLLRVVFGFYLVVMIVTIIGQMVVDYQYQTNSIRKEFLQIQSSFEQFLAEELWALDEESVRASVRGIIGLPVIVGMKLQDQNGKTIAVAGIVKIGNDARETGCTSSSRDAIQT